MATQSRSKALALLVLGALLTFAVLAQAQGSCFLTAARLTGTDPSLRVSRIQMDAGGYQVPMQDRDLIQPDEEPSRSNYLFGFVKFAEMFNGRIAMIFFFVLIFLEFFANKGVIELVGVLLGDSSFGMRK
ncbi:unnamed protein product [Polarella glacialis]|uniref:High light inducible protein n=1 Tax=Polarella glacialis TaxID=89957 RepID=A0A813JIT9_POLGL|nr:unnamed protein product [Polarella glacialis]|mmetsp:Transcript_85606/g.154080  ORF Transcript_85606/g.154080 Transcript_85606/m.154080 type:complete len:130 (-) Transcript_85606:97-486(-)